MQIIGIPLGWIMTGMYAVIKNYGIVLILFTFLIRLCLLPLNIKQQKSTAKMSLIQPKIQKIQQKYGKDKNRVQEETMKLYEEEGYNPMAGCWPMALQMLFLFGIIEVVYRPMRYLLHISTDTISAASTILTDAGLKSVSASNAQLHIINILQNNYDILTKSGMDTASINALVEKISACFDANTLSVIQNFNIKCFGFNLGSVPTLTWPIILLPIISGITSIGVSILSMRQQKQNAVTKEQQQSMKSMKIMMYLMPLMSVYFAFQLPTGVVFYWIASNIFSLFQTYILNKFYSPEKMKAKVEQENAERKKNPSRYQQAMRDARKMQAAKDGKKFDDSPVDLDSDEEKAEKAKADKEKQLSNAERLAAARKRMAEKYGDEYDL